MLLDLAGHAVERAGKLSQLVIGRTFLDARRQVAAPHPLRRQHQAADRLGQPRREQDRQPHRRQQHQERDGAADHEDEKLAALHRLLDLRIERAGELDALDVVDDAQVDRMAGDQEQRFAEEELHDEVGAVGRLDLDRAGLADGPPQRLSRRHGVLQAFGIGRHRALQHAVVGIDDDRLDDRPAVDQPLEQAGRRLLVAHGVDADRLQGGGNGADIAQDLFFARAPHRLADRPRRLVRGLGRLHHEVRQVDDHQRQDDGHDQGRRDSEHAAHQDQAHVKARAGGTAPAIQPELREPHRQQGDQRHGDHQIGHQQSGDPATRVEGDRREAGQPGIGGGAGKDREHGK